MPPIQVKFENNFNLFDIKILVIIISNMLNCFYRSSDCDIDLVPLDTFCRDAPLSVEDVVCEYNNDYLILLVVGTSLLS